MSVMVTLLLDTNLLIVEPDFALLGVAPEEIQVRTSALCYAELQEGELAQDPIVAAQAIMQLSNAEAALGEGIPFGADEVRAYRAICAAVRGEGRSLTRARRLDMMIAATALAHGLTLATRNVDDFTAVRGVVPVIRL